jgi:hypothetical protein
VEVLRPVRMAEVVLLLVGKYEASFADMVKLSNHASSAGEHTVFVLNERQYQTQSVHAYCTYLFGFA